MNASLRDKRVIVTAAASGIGWSIAQAFFAAGAAVHICDIDGLRLDAARAAVPEIGTTLADVSNPAEVALCFERALQQLGGLDILVNNAGIVGPIAPVEETDYGDWRRTIDVNLHGQFLCAKAAIPPLKNTGSGSIITMSSAAGQRAMPRRASYVATKWALIGFTHSLAMELAPHNIRVNAICPGAVEGERMERVIAGDARARGIAVADVRHDVEERLALHPYVRAADVANMVLFLCSDEGARISGQALTIAGHTP